MAKSNNKGFTIIEVALVLAIAGLIFLVVFLALPALQRSQRDTARRQSVGNVVSALQNFESNNQGSLAGLTAGSATAPNGSGTNGAQALFNITGALSNVDTIQVVTTATAPSDNNTVVVTSNALCGSTTGTDGKAITSGTSVNGKTVSARDAAAVMKLESNSYYCADM